MGAITRLEMEKLLTTVCMQGREATAHICNTLSLDESEFEDTSLRMLYASCVSLYAKHKEIDPLSVQNFLREELHQTHFVGVEKTKEVERLSLLAKDIAKEYNSLRLVCSPESAVKYLKNETRRRNLLQIVHKINDKLIGGGALDEVTNYGITELMNFLHNLQNISGNTYRSLAQAIAEVDQEIQNELEGKINWLSTGIEPIDRMIQGLHFGRLYIIGAEAKVGKSLLSDQIALINALQNIPAGIISMEMPGKEIAKRYSGISQFQNPNIKKQLLEAFRAMVKNVPLYFRQGGVTSKSLFSSLQKLVIDKKCKLIVLDYLQLVQLDEKYRNPVDGINSMMAQIKGFAEENHVAILVVSALLTKQVAKRKTNKPSSADIVGTGRAVNDCDCLLLLWKPKKANSKMIEIFVEQGRNGEHGKTELFINEKLRITAADNLKSEPIPFDKSDEESIYTKKY
jgi:replicative DNA helicase